MTIDYRRYGKGPRHARNHRVSINIRLRRHKSLGGPPTAEEVRDVLQQLLDTGVVPRGWQFAAIEWGRPDTAYAGWRQGRLRDFDALRDVIQWEIDNLRIALVRPGQ